MFRINSSRKRQQNINTENEKQHLSTLKPKLDHFNIFGILSEKQLSGVAGLGMYNFISDNRLFYMEMCKDV